MNTRYNMPEIIGNHRIVNQDGEDSNYCYSIVGIRALGNERSAVLQIDIQQFRVGKNLVIEFELHEIVAAISLATLRAEMQ